MIIRPTTKELLAASLRELSARKPVDKITVREIAQNCGFTAKTFYNHFRDKYDLIEWIYASFAGEVMDRIGSGGYEWRDSLADGLNYFLENREFLRNLVEHTGGQDSFLNYVARFNVKILSDHLRRTQHWEELPPDVEIFVKVYCYGTVCMFIELLTNPLPMPAVEFVGLIEKSLPEPLRKFLYKPAES